MIKMKPVNSKNPVQTAMAWICSAAVVLSIGVTGGFVYTALNNKGLLADAAGQNEDENANGSMYKDPQAVSALLASQIDAYISDKGYDRNDLAIDIETNDRSVTYTLNPDMPFQAASTYKLPLAMLYVDMMTSGAIAKDATLPFEAQDIREEGWNPIADTYALGSQVPVEEAIHSALASSDNTAAAILYNGMGGWEAFVQARNQYSASHPAAENSLDNLCTASQIMDELRRLTGNARQYELVIESLDDAPGDLYLNEYIEDDSMIQKYGQYEGVTNSVGFSKTGTPYRIVVLSKSADNTIDPAIINEIAWNVLNETPQASEKVWELERPRKGYEEIYEAIDQQVEQSAAPSQSETSPEETTPYFPAYTDENQADSSVQAPAYTEPVYTPPVTEPPADQGLTSQQPAPVEPPADDTITPMPAPDDAEFGTENGDQNLGQ